MIGDIQDVITQHLQQNPSSRIHTSFITAIVFAYRNLYEQSDEGFILTPTQFLELLMKGGAATRAEAVGHALRDLVPNPSAISKDDLFTAYLSAAIRATLEEDQLSPEFADLIRKLILTQKPKPGVSS